MGVVFVGYDVSLNRKVALKLVRRQLLDKAKVRDRMMREAKAMARLSSPYVVQVFQVGDHEDGIYLAMEYIEGQTLGGWLRSERPHWTRVLRTVCDAGRGLAAAHAAGLVHRDFKPDNVLVDAEGRARVLDFGLVQTDVMGGDETVDPTSEEGAVAVTQAGEGDVERSNLHWSVRLTQMGNVLGTPAYMSPEQHFGKPAGPASDQFSFAVTLYEALYGARPFGGDTWQAIRAAIREGIVPPPPLESRVPRRVFRALARSLSTDAGGRWPSMEALLEALEQDRWKVRARVAGMGALVAVASAASYLAAAAQSAPPSCEANGQEFAGVWDGERQAAIERAFAATQAPFAADAATRVKARIDSYVQAWRAGRQAACEARTSGEMETLSQRRLACLERRKLHLTTLLDVLAAADRAVVENSVQAVAALPSIQACSDAEALLGAAAAPPDDPATGRRVEELRARLSRVAALESTGQYDAGVALAAELHAAAEPLGYVPLAAEVSLAEGRVRLAAGQPREADEALRRTLRLALTHDLHALAAEAAARRIYVLGAGLGQLAEALATEPVATPLVERASDEGLTALLLNNLAVAYDLRRDYEKAQSHYQRAIEVLQRRSDQPDPLIPVTYNNLGNMYLDAGRPEVARDYFARARDLFVAGYGERHPLVAHPLSGLGDVYLREGSMAEARSQFEQAIALMEVAYGDDHVYLVAPLAGLGRAFAASGRSDEARRVLARTLAIAERVGEVSRPVGEALSGLAELSEGAAKEQARGLYARAAAVFEQAIGAESEEAARAGLRAGELAAELGDAEAAIGWFERVMAKQTGPKRHSSVRATAALRLAAALSPRGGAGERVCALAQEADAALAQGDPRHAEARALVAARCPGGG